MFFMITWYGLHLEPTVAALCIEIRRASVPGWPNTLPTGFKSRNSIEYFASMPLSSSQHSSLSATTNFRRCFFHAVSSTAEQALRISSKSC